MNNKGFTIIELIVIMGIVAALSSVMFIDFGGNRNDFALNRSTQQLAQDIRRTQEMAISALIGDEGTVGYGIYLSKALGSETQYIIYANNNVNVYYEVGTDSIKETRTFESGIKICDIKDNEVSEADNVMSISFAPPDPINYIESNYSGHEASIKVCVASDESQYKIVKINNSGRIEVVD